MSEDEDEATRPEWVRDVRLVDAGALIELWDEVYLPPRTRAAWRPLVESSAGSPSGYQGRALSAMIESLCSTAKQMA